MADVAYGSLPFREQIEFFRRKVNVNTERWTDVWEAAHDHAFMVAGANRADLVADFRAAVERAIAEGATLEDFRKDFDRIVAKYGWSYNGGRNWRSRVIYETNLRTSYAAGRWAQLQEERKWRPYWQYVHSDAVEHPRPLHVAWDGLILAADDPWWLTHFPPNGWGCQCSVQSLAARDLKRMGKTGPDQAPDDGTHVVTVGKRGPAPFDVETPVGVDPGFGYAPGRAAFERLVQESLGKHAALPVTAAAASTEELLAGHGVVEALVGAFRAWLADTAADAADAIGSLWIGAIESRIVARLAGAGRVPATALIGVDEATALALRGRPIAGLDALPRLLRSPIEVYWDASRDALVYLVRASSDGDTLRLVWIRDGRIIDVRAIDAAEIPGATRGLDVI